MMAPFINSTESALQLLRGHPDYRVLTRFTPVYKYKNCVADAALRFGLYVDVETTGVDVNLDKIVEVGVVKFSYDDRGNILEVIEEFEAFEDPGIPIPPEASAINGIHDEDVKGKAIDDSKISSLLEGVSIVISHNASFDRKMIERRFRGFDLVPWGCSWKEVPWESSFNSVGAKLGNILIAAGKFCEGHRALLDCQVGVYVLATMEAQGKGAFSYLLESSKERNYLIPAIQAPYDKKDMLKARKYQWHKEAKVWWVEKRESDLSAELEYLENVIGCAELKKRKFRDITAIDRYSIRCEKAMQDNLILPDLVTSEQVKEIEAAIGSRGWLKYSILKGLKVSDVFEIESKYFECVIDFCKKINA